MKLPRGTKLTLLTAAVNMPSPTGHKMCFHRSAGLCLDLPGSELVTAVFRPATDEEAAAIAARGDTPSREPFLHAWVEWNGWVLSPTTLEQTGMQLAPMRPDTYYAINGATNVKRVSRPALKRIARDTGLVAHLKHDADLKASFVQAILTAAHQPFAVTPDGGLVPAS